MSNLTNKYQISVMPEPHEMPMGLQSGSGSAGSSSGSFESSSSSDCEELEQDCGVMISAGGGGTVVVGDQVMFNLNAAPTDPTSSPCCSLDGPLYSFSVGTIQKRMSTSEEWQTGSGNLYIVHEDPASSQADVFGSLAEPGYYRIAFSVTASWTGTTEDGEPCGSCDASSETTAEAKAFDVTIEADHSQTVCIGEKVCLTATVEPVPEDPESVAFQWTLPTGVIKGYTLTGATYDSIPIPATSATHSEADREQSAICFYFVEPTDSATAKVQVTMDGKTKEQEYNLTVVDPTGADFINVVQKPKEEILLQTANGISLSYGTKPIPPDPENRTGEGITADGIMTAPAGCGGRVGLIQIVKSIRQHRYQSDDIRGVLCTSWRFDTKNIPTLDRDGTMPFYNNQNQEVTASNNSSVYFRDSPLHTATGNNLVELNVEEHFTVYLIWRPEGDESIWVAVKQMTWGWKARGVKVDSDGDGIRDEWRLDTSGGSSGRIIYGAEVNDFHGTVEWNNRVLDEYQDFDKENPFWENSYETIGACP